METATNKKELSKARRRDEREKLKARLYDECRADLAKKLEVCGDELPLTCVNCGNRKIASMKCKKRWCPSCAYHIAAERVAKYKDIARRFAWPLFVTLTMRNTIDPEGLKEMKKAFGKWRRRKLVREKVKSGIVGFEVTNKGKGWHPHAHMLLDCRWLSLHVPEPNRTDSKSEKERKCKAAAAELERLWCDVLKQETASVKVRRGDADALVEVLKYSCKGSELIECQGKASDLIDVMESMRLMTTFGEVRKLLKEEADADLEEPEQTGCQCEACRAIGTMIPDKFLRFT